MEKIFFLTYPNVPPLIMKKCEYSLIDLNIPSHHNIIFTHGMCRDPHDIIKKLALKIHTRSIEKP
jgi:hypothetical protein